MALRIVSGTLGAGKTYYAVSMIIKDFCHFVPETNSYQLRSDVHLISNIDGLLLPHTTLQASIPSGSSVDQFFSHDYQESFSRSLDKSIVYIIDEAQVFFHKKYYNLDVFRFFELHRHFGMDIYLITQNTKRFCQSIIDLAECTVKAQSRSVGFLGELKYIHLVQEEIVDRSILKPNKKIFALYKSAEKKEFKKIKNPFIKYFVVLVIAFLGAGWYFYHYLFNKPNILISKAQAQSEIINKNKPVSPSLSSTSPSPVASQVGFLDKEALNPDTSTKSIRLSYIKRSNGDLLFINPVHVGNYFVRSQSPWTLKIYDHIYYADIPLSEVALIQEYQTPISYHPVKNVALSK